MNKYNAILSMFEELSNILGEECPEIAEMYILLSNQEESHVKIQVKFSQFLSMNRRTLEELNETFERPIFKFRGRAINFDEVFKRLDEESRVIMWIHLLNLYFKLVSKTDSEKIKTQLRALVSESQVVSQAAAPTAGTANFVTGMIDKVTKHMKNYETAENDNPIELIGNMMKDGVFTEILTDMQNNISSGELDVNQLFQTMMGQMSQLDQLQLDQLDNK